MTEPLLITPTELRQHHYCPRVVFFERCTPVKRRETMMMTFGKEKHEKELKLERRRALSRYDLVAGERQYDVRLTSFKLGLSGELDLLIVNQGEAYPIEFKHSKRPPDAGHKLQLCAYGLLIEEMLGVKSPYGYWHSSKTRLTQQIEFDTRLRNRTLKAIDTVRAFILAEQCPAPTSNTEKCLECELKNFCGDTL